MTEREKMMAGVPYNSAVAEIRKLHLTGKKLMWEWNQAAPDDLDRQTKILTRMLGAFGKRARVNHPFWIDYGCNIYLGEHCFINMNCTLLDAGNIVIGDRTLLAPDVKIYTALHPVNGYQRYADYSNQTCCNWACQLDRRQYHSAGRYHWQQCDCRRRQRCNGGYTG